MSMYRDCGKFITATLHEGDIVRLKKKCPSCSGVEFKYNSTKTLIRTDVETVRGWIDSD